MAEFQAWQTEIFITYTSDKASEEVHSEISKAIGKLAVELKKQFEDVDFSILNTYIIVNKTIDIEPSEEDH